LFCREPMKAQREGKSITPREGSTHVSGMRAPLTGDGQLIATPSPPAETLKSPERKPQNVSAFALTSSCCR
jgi:hypothetical protein